MKKEEKSYKNIIKRIITIIIMISLIIIIYIGTTNDKIKRYVENIFDSKDVWSLVTNIIEDLKKETDENIQVSFDLDGVPEFKGKPYVVINNNKPGFKEEEITLEVFEKYSELDALGRCGFAFANICKELMPTGTREEIGMIKPSGWKYDKYDFIDGRYLYNRCHLIAFQLAGENANEKNLITGTRYFNVQGMLPFENKVAEYVKRKNKHVLYRVTPIFKGNNLIASGVQMEALSVEDRGKSISFNIYVYNNQPGVEIDYKTGKSYLKK